LTRPNNNVGYEGEGTPMLIALALLASAPLSPAATIAQIDRTFVCPESLPSDSAKEAAMVLFVAQARSAGLNTVRTLMKLRVQLLREHGCSVSLANIEAQGQ
jgi:hypothetical protein